MEKQMLQKNILLIEDDPRVDANQPTTDPFPTKEIEDMDTFLLNVLSPDINYTSY